ncbi:MAG: lactonase family protein [Robiginitalea sp.]|uniref:lactonase family protein n=1 Tax=Robiginitalea sp. TaxID=1902411 RepID=UPI003C748CC7
MPRFIPALCTVLIITVNCKGPSPESAKDTVQETVEQTEPDIPFYLGTYTDGESQGIYQYSLSADGTLSRTGLVVEAENPSFLALSADGNYLLAVNEVSNAEQTGFVSSFRIGKDTLTFLDQKPTGGAHPCHVAVNPEGYVLVANYSGGNMGLLKIEADGKLSDLMDVQQHEGSGRHPRQEGPHAHSGWFTQDEGIISVDLGANQLWFSEIDTQSQEFTPREPQIFSLEPGAGPRHLTFHPQKPWIYVVNELSSSVSLLKKDPETGAFIITQTISTLPEGSEMDNTCADIHISSDGKFLYASNRGHNSIVVYSMDPGTGELKFKAHEPTRGETPRNFSLSPGDRFLLVANQTTNTVVSFKRNSSSGLLTYVDQVKAPTPVCILFNPVP